MTSPLIPSLHADKAHELGLQHVNSEGDSFEAYKILHQLTPLPWKLGHVIEDILLKLDHYPH